jgi:glutaredoxin
MKLDRTWKRIAMATVSALAATIFWGSQALAGGDWNDAGVAWQPYEAGLEQAAADHKPVMLIFYTDWCPHCTQYSKLFHDPSMVEKSAAFVMIRLNKDQNAELSGKYAPDGEYIPRTYFLAPDGAMWEDIHAPRPQYKHFFSYDSPKYVLAAMDKALARLADGGAAVAPTGDAPAGEAPAAAPAAEAPPAKEAAPAAAE